MLTSILGVLFAISAVVRADWADATWFDGVVQIPITIDEHRGSLWLTDLVVWDEDAGNYIVGGYCTLDNNSANTVIFSPKISSFWSGWFDVDDASCTSEATEHYTESGETFDGYMCR